MTTRSSPLPRTVNATWTPPNSKTPRPTPRHSLRMEPRPRRPTERTTPNEQRRRKTSAKRSAEHRRQAGPPEAGLPRLLVGGEAVVPDLALPRHRARRGDRADLDRVVLDWRLRQVGHRVPRHPERPELPYRRQFRTSAGGTLRPCGRDLERGRRHRAGRDLVDPVQPQRAVHGRPARRIP